MVRFTEPLGAQYGVRAICGKGGFPDEAIEPMQRLGMVYFAIVGGAAALETTQIEEIEEVAWEELMPECLWKFRVKDFGPLTSASTRTATRSTTTSRPRPEKKLEELYAGSDRCLDLPAAPGKPRAAAHARHGQGPKPRDIEGMFDTAGARRHRQARLGHLATSPKPREEDRALPLFRDARRLWRHLFEAVYARGKPTSSSPGSTEHRFSHVEISDGTLDIPRERKLEPTSDFARDFTVLSEVGSKDSDMVFAPASSSSLIDSTHWYGA